MSGVTYAQNIDKRYANNLSTNGAAVSKLVSL